MDLHSFERDPQTVAVRLAASDLFGVLQRSVRLPPGCGGLVLREDGSTAFAPAGATVESRGAREVVAIRATPIDVSFSGERVESSDGFACEARLRLSIHVVPERSEFEAFCRAILGSSRRAEARRIELYVADTVRKALHEFASQHAAETLVRSMKDEEFVARLADALKPVAFAAGLALGRAVTLEIASPAYDEARRRTQLESTERQRLEQETRLRDAAGEMRLKHVEHLSAVLDRLDGLAKQRPGVSMGELIRTFDAGERAELYRQMLSRALAARRTAAAAVVAGTELLLFDPNDGSVQLRRAFDGPLGALRSVRHTMHDGVEGLLLGAARGVYHYVRMSDRLTAYAFEPAGRLRGGVNAAVIHKGILYATHSEVGVIRWETDSPRPGQTILADQTSGAQAVRDIQSDERGTLWFTAGDRVIGWSSESGATGVVQTMALPTVDGKRVDGSATLNPSITNDRRDAGPTSSSPAAMICGVGRTGDVSPPVGTMGTLVSVGSIAGGGGSPRVAALCVANGSVFAGTSDGRLLAWPCHAPRQVETLLSGEGGGVESVQWLSGAGVERLLVACRRPAAWLLVRGDACRMEYRTDEPVRWAAAADDWIIGVTDRRDRLQLWRPARPEAVERTIWVGRLAGHSIQDAALVPQAGL